MAVVATWTLMGILEIGDFKVKAETNSSQIYCNSLKTFVFVVDYSHSALYSEEKLISFLCWKISNHTIENIIVESVKAHTFV